MYARVCRIQLTMLELQTDAWHGLRLDDLLLLSEQHRAGFVTQDDRSSIREIQQPKSSLPPLLLTNPHFSILP